MQSLPEALCAKEALERISPGDRVAAVESRKYDFDIVPVEAAGEVSRGLRLKDFNHLVPARHSGRARDTRTSHEHDVARQVEVRYLLCERLELGAEDRSRCNHASSVSDAHLALRVAVVALPREGPRSALVHCWF
jgi:hypothetical protein